MMERLRAVKINLRELLIGTLLMGLSLLLPMVVQTTLETRGLPGLATPYS